MSNSQARIHLVCGIVAIGLLAASIPSRSYAQDSERIEQLEKEVRELKLRLSRLESNPGETNKRQSNLGPSDLWKSKSNWRQLKREMSPDDVRNLLGEPWYIKGGTVEFWYYQKGRTDASLTFMLGRLESWSEPQ